jgi:hypothetical protein
VCSPSHLYCCAGLTNICLERPQRGERRPQYSGSRGACHAHVPELSGTAAPPDSSDPSSPALVFSLHPIGGFCAVSSRLPLPPRIETEITTEAITKGGLNAIFDQNIYCVAAEPHATLLRIGVTQDRVQEVAYATIVLGKLRPGYRVFQLRGSQHGTRIELCHLFVHIGVGGRLNLWQNPRQVRARTLACVWRTFHMRVFPCPLSTSMSICML